MPHVLLLLCAVMLAACATSAPTLSPTTGSTLPSASAPTANVAAVSAPTVNTAASSDATTNATPRAQATLLPEESPPDGAAQFSTDFSRHTVPYSEIRAGGPPKDGIPAIDTPQIMSVSAADAWLKPQEPVVVVQVGDAVRAYPIQILMWHEIANDTLGDVPITVTFCPLCNTAIVFDRRLDGRVLDFGTTGLLRYSNLIMYDRQSESWWQQASGQAVAGTYAGTQLAMLPATMIAWDEFRTTYPNGTVLSQETGIARDYGRNPYTGYDDIRRAPFLYDGPTTPDALPATARVLTVDRGSEAVAYPYDLLSSLGAINDTVDGLPVVVLWQSGTASALDAGSVADGRDVGAAAAFSRVMNNRTLTFTRDGELLRDAETGSAWNLFGQAIAGPLAGTQLESVVAINHFWFSWAAFKPETRIYQP